MIDLGTDEVYIILVYAKRWGFTLKRQRNLYSLDMADGIPIAHNKGIID